MIVDEAMTHILLLQSQKFMQRQYEKNEKLQRKF